MLRVSLRQGVVMSTPKPAKPERTARLPWVAFWLFIVVMVALWIAAVYFVWWLPPRSLFDFPLIGNE